MKIVWNRLPQALLSPREIPDRQLPMTTNCSKQSQLVSDTPLSATRSFRLRPSVLQCLFECPPLARRRHATLMIRMYASARYEISYFHRLSAVIVWTGSSILTVR